MIVKHNFLWQVSSALHCLRERNTYQGKYSVTWPRPVTNFADPGSALTSYDRPASQTQEVGAHVNEIMDSSRTKARTMVDAAMQVNKSILRFQVGFISRNSL